jgi:hypothetical protein
VDANRFDHLARIVVQRRSRRGLLPVLAGLPLAGAIAGLLPKASADNARRGKDRERIAAERKKRRKCKPKPIGKACSGKCGRVLNNCKKPVTCEPCPCDPACPECERCNQATTTCEPDPGKAGDACGDSGQICLADGSCACDAGSCGACRTCAGGACAPVTGGSGCGNGKQCCGNPIACVDVRIDSGNCGGCGVVCAPGRACRKGICDLCVCPDSGECFASVQEAVDAAHDGDVIRICAGQFTGADARIDVPGGLTLTIVGEGSGENPLANTVLDSPGVETRGVRIGAGATVTMRDLRIRGGAAFDWGGGVQNFGTLLMRDCAVVDNIAPGLGGGIYNGSNGDLTLIDCLVSRNFADQIGGGIYNLGTLTLNGNTSLTENDAGGGGGLANILFAVAEINNASTISDNDADQGAGVLNAATLTLNNATSMLRNSALDSGGGLFNESTGVVTLNNASTIADNAALLNVGGGIQNEGTVILNNASSVTGNDAPTSAGIRNLGTIEINDQSTVEDCEDVSGGTGCP